MLREPDIIALFKSDADTLDDCALLPLKGLTLISTDSLSEGTHFRRDWSSPEDVATKLIHVNVSDIYASGGRPACCTLNLGLPLDLADSFVERFARAFVAELDSLGIDLLGGDTFRSDSMQLGLTMLGQTSRHVTRSGGRPGDSLYVTGALGLSAAGFAHLSGRIQLSHELTKKALDRHLRPRAAGPFAMSDDVHAAMDVSDGVVQDSVRLSRASGLTLDIHLDRLPSPDGLLAFLSPREIAISGEELELLFLAPPGFRGFPCTEIGYARAGEGVAFYMDGKKISVDQGFEHFSSKSVTVHSADGQAGGQR
ncbi:MAG: thiamine-phosphate kinase [Leptospirales bacterium]|nr:thiamine-phosphate kinase [Leptospirales bacterium]